MYWGENGSYDLRPSIDARGNTKRYKESVVYQTVSLSSALVEGTMTGNKKVMCNVCYKEMRSDVLTRHMKQHSKKEELNSTTNISVTNNYNTEPGVCTKRKDEENENNDEELKKYLIKLGNEYQEKLVQGKKIYKMLGEGIAPYQALTRDMKEKVDLYIENQQ